MDSWWCGMALRGLRLPSSGFWLGVSQPKPFLNTYHPPKLGFSSGVGSPEYLPIAEWPWPSSTGVNLHYLYLGGLKPLQQIRVRSSLEAPTSEPTLPAMGSEHTWLQENLLTERTWSSVILKSICKQFDHETLQNLPIDRYGVCLTGVQREGSRIMLNPGPHYVLEETDTLFYISITKEEHSSLSQKVSLW